MRVDQRLHLTDDQGDVVLSELAATLVLAVDGVRDADDVLATAVTSVTGVDAAEAEAAWHRLLHRRLVVDADEHLRRVATLQHPAVDPGAAIPLTDLLSPSDGDRRWLARQACRVSVRGGGATADSLVELLGASGVPTGEQTARMPDLVVLTHDHEPAADLVQSLVRADVPHLIGGLRDATARVGPLVVPGWSACARCYDLHRTAAEPSWRWRRPLLARPAVHPLGCSTAPPTVVQVAAALLAAETITFVEGRTPQTCGGTLELTSEAVVPAWHRLEPHPWCGCVWPTKELDGTSTMDA